MHFDFKMAFSQDKLPMDEKEALFFWLFKKTPVLNLVREKV
jgi:hypothetical protein